jgi:hypothetical protein
LRTAALAGLRYQLARTFSAPGWDAVLRCLASSPAAATLWDEHEVAFPVAEQCCRRIRPGGGTEESTMILHSFHPDLWLYALIPEPGTQRY